MIFIVHFHIMALPFKKEMSANSKNEAEQQFIKEFQEIPDYNKAKEQ